MRSSLLFLCILICLTYSCKEKTTSGFSAESSHWENIPEEMRKGLEAHGGLALWQKKKTMEFSIPKGDNFELHQIDLPSRKVRIDHPDYSIGFDGNEVWITPDKETFGSTSPRFYHNLISTFSPVLLSLLIQGFIMKSFRKEH